MTKDEKVSILLANGWLEYHGNTWYNKKEWADAG